MFDGATTKGWRGFKKAGFPAKGWSVESGRLKHAASGGQPTADSGDIITVETFNDFDLRFEWVVAPGANSGIKYLVTEERDGPIAHEYQIIDDAKHPDALIGPHRATAALYDVIAAPASKILKPATQRNEGRILVQGNHVEHWLNGAKVIEYELGSAALKAAKAKSKFKDVRRVGRQAQGPHPAAGSWRRGLVSEHPHSRAERRADVTSLAPPARRACRPSTRSSRGSDSWR